MWPWVKSWLSTKIHRKVDCFLWVRGWNALISTKAPRSTNEKAKSYLLSNEQIFPPNRFDITDVLLWQAIQQKSSRAELKIFCRHTFGHAIQSVWIHDFWVWLFSEMKSTNQNRKICRLNKGNTVCQSPCCRIQPISCRSASCEPLFGWSRDKGRNMLYNKKTANTQTDLIPGGAVSQQCHHTLCMPTTYPAGCMQHNKNDIIHF